MFGEREVYESIDLYGGGTEEDYKRLMEYYDVYQKIGGYPAVVARYAEDKDMEACFELLKTLLDIFINESKRYFTDIMDINLFRSSLMPSHC